MKHAVSRWANRWSGVGIALGVALAAFGCTKKADETPAAAAEGAAKTARAAPSTLNLAIWSNYVSPELLTQFEKATKIKVAVSNYSSNEELLAKLQAGASGYDVVVPSDYMVFAMVKLGLLKPLDLAQIPNAKLLEAKLLRKTFDPENKHSLPYDWGTTGIAVNRELYKGELKGWKQLFENDALAGKFTLLDDVRETTGAALKALGKSLNTREPADLDAAKKLLLKIRTRVKAFTSEPMASLVSGETAVAHAYLSDALQARRETGGKIEYIIPEEGATLWIDNLVIPSGAAHVREAHAFINYLLEAKSNVTTVLSVMVAPANREVFAILPEDIRKNTSLFPPEAVMRTLEMMNDLGEAMSIWDRAWTEVKASSG